MTGRIRFYTGAVDRNDGQAVGHAVAALNQLPGLALLGLLPVRVRGYAADGGRVDEQFGAVQGHGTGGFRIPLVPADQYSQRCHRGFDGLESQVSGSEIELLVEERVVRDVHFAVLSGDAAIGLQYHGGIVVDAGCTALEQRQHDDHAQFLGQGAERLRGRAGNGFCQVAQAGVFFLAEIQAVVQFLQNYQLGTLGGACADIGLKAGDVARNVGGAVLLHHSNLERSHYL